MMKTIFIVLCFAFTLNAQAVGFKSGNAFTAKNLHGDFWITCQAQGFPSTPQYVACNESHLFPGELDFFVGPSDTAANKVVLESRDPNDNRSVRKQSGYKNGESKDPFNLWIATLTQTPLLQLGDNYVSYKLLKGNQELASGGFTATVNDGGDSKCATEQYQSFDPTYCQNPELLCGQYFAEQDYCAAH